MAEIKRGMPFEEYLKVPAFSKSVYRPTMRSAKALRHYLKNEQAQTKTMDFGSLVDALLLEPHTFAQNFVARPETYETIKEYKTKRSETIVKPWSAQSNTCKAWAEQHKDKTIMSADDLKRANKIVSEIKNHPSASNWLSRAEFQVSIFWEHEGQQCKGRIDALIPGERIIDLKITEDPLPKSFERTVFNFGYHIQGAMYHDGYCACEGLALREYEPTIPFSLIVAEANPPHDVVCYTLGPESFEVGRILWMRGAERYREIMESGDASGYSSVDETIEIPAYARNAVLLEGRMD